jgi:hypothetical protein
MNSTHGCFEAAAISECEALARVHFLALRAKERETELSKEIATDGDATDEYRTGTARNPAWLVGCVFAAAQCRSCF